jgi:YD repeat-containing protein
VGTGAFTHDETDLALRTTAFGINVSRYYDSSRAVDGPMGVGWTTSLSPRIYYATFAATPTTLEHKAYVIMPHGSLWEFTRTASGSFTPPVGRRDTLVLNGDGTYTLSVQSSGPVLRFNATGGMTSMTDEFGNAILYTYDANGRIQRVADGAGSGRYADVTWNAAGRIESVTDSAGRTVRYGYDAAGKLMTVADAVTPSGEQSRYYTYEQGRFGAPQLARIEDRWHRLISRIVWDASGRVLSYTEGEYNDASPASSPGEKYTYQYFPNGAPPAQPDPYTIKASSLGSKSYRYTPATGLVTNDSTRYDALGQMTSAYPESNGRREYTYDTQGRMLTEKIFVNTTTPSPDIIWTYTYDPVYPTKVTSRKSSRPDLWAGARYEYYQAQHAAPGALHGVWSIRSDGTTEDLIAGYNYDGRGRVLLKQGTPGVPNVAYLYDAAGNLESAATTGAGTITYGHDHLGRVTSSTDQAGAVTTYTYDAADRIKTVTLPKPTLTSTLDFTTTYSYDEYDALTGLTFARTVDPNQKTTKAGYDTLGNLVQSVDAGGNVTTYAYQYNLLKSITDANGNSTTYGYDLNRQLSSTIFPDGAVETYLTREGGLLSESVDRRGNKVRYNYDAYGRLTRDV